MTRSPTARATAEAQPERAERGAHWLPARRWRWLLSSVAVASLVAVGLVPGPSQAQATECTDSLTGVSTSGDLVVPAGEACTLTNVVVSGNATVGANADLFLIDSNVSNELVLNTSAFAQVTNTTVSARTRLVDAFGLLVEGSTLSSGVAVDGGQFFSSGTNLSGSVDSTNGRTFIEAGQVSADVTTIQDQSTDLVDVSMSGFFRVNAATDGSVVCRSTVSGLVEVTGSGGLIQIGGDQPAADCGGNVVNGEIVLDSNDADTIVVSDNLLFGDLTCVNNTPAPSGSGNEIDGDATGQCAEFGSASAPQEVSQTESSSVAERRQAILQSLAQRGGTLG